MFFCLKRNYAIASDVALKKAVAADFSLKRISSEAMA